MKPRFARAPIAGILLASSALAVPPTQAPGSSPQPASRSAEENFTLNGAFVQGGLAKGVAPFNTVSLTLDGKAVPLDPARRFIIGFDRDQAAVARLTATLANGRQIVRPLNVARRSWRIEHINAARRPLGPSADFLRRREQELGRIATARARKTGAAGWMQNFIWPSRGRISGRFGSQRVYRGEPAAFHSGVDLAPGAGATVVAPADGVVVLAAPPMFSLEGNLVIIDHGMGLNSAFLHLASYAVREGEPVRRGQKIGTVGATGRATGPHLHWSVKWEDARLDPERLVSR